MLPPDSDILDRLRDKGSRVLSFQELMKAFRLRDMEETAFRSRLDALERRGEITRVRGKSTPPSSFPT